MKKYNPESMRAQTRQGTLHLIAAGGMSKFSFLKLTAATGIVAPTVYELYKNKEDLLTTCFLEIDADRTLFYQAFCSSEYYTEAVIRKRDEHYRQFTQYVDEIDRRFHISERCSVHVLVMNLIDGTLGAAVKVFRGEFKNDNVTINTIYHAIFQPVFALLELEK